MSESVYLTPEERMNKFSDSLIQSIIKSDEASIRNRKYLFGQVSASIFRNENYILFLTFYNFKGGDITPDEDFLKIYLTRNTKMFKDASEYINLTEFKDLDDDPYLAYASAVLKQFNRLSTLDVLSYEDFKLTLEKYKLEYSAYEAGVAYSQGKMILYEGMQFGSRMYQGYSDSVAFVKKKLAGVEGVLNKTTGTGFIDSRVAAIDSDDKVKPEKIGDFDLLTGLNKQLDGIYTDTFYNIVAPTKGGKSKFTTRMSHTVAVQYGHPITVWAQEGGYEAWWAQLRAIHFEYMYIRNRPENERVAPLSQKQILYGRYPSEEIRQLEEVSKLDLFTNPRYGDIGMIDRPFKLENLIEDIDTQVKLNNSKFVLIDYLQLITADNRGLSKNEVIGRAYQACLDYCKKAHVALVSPSQFKQEFINDLASSGKTPEVRTGGGESAEVIRTPDINIALYASVEDLIRKEMTIMSMPSRLCEPFPDEKIYADLCSCVFSSIS